MAWLFGLTFGYMQDDQTMKVCSCLVPLTADMRSRKKQAVPAPRGDSLRRPPVPSMAGCSCFLFRRYLPATSEPISIYRHWIFPLFWAVLSMCVEQSYNLSNTTLIQLKIVPMWGYMRCIYEMCSYVSISIFDNNLHLNYQRMPNSNKTCILIL